MEFAITTTSAHHPDCRWARNARVYHDYKYDPDVSVSNALNIALLLRVRWGVGVCRKCLPFLGRVAMSGYADPSQFRSYETRTLAKAQESEKAIHARMAENAGTDDDDDLLLTLIRLRRKHGMTESEP